VRVLRSPVLQFLVASLLLFGLTWLVTGRLSQTAARDEALADARVSTELLANSVAAPNIPKGMADGDPGAIDRFYRAVGKDLIATKAASVTRIKIWSADGTVVYSDQPDLILKKFKLDPEQLEVLNSGATEGSVSDLRRSENKFETEEDGLLEVYTRIESPEGKPLLFEAYYPVATVQDRASQVLTPFRRISTLGLAAILLLGVPIILALTLRLTRASRARERLMERAIDSSEAERRRIARDLHDGVVQELAGTAFALSGAAREPSVSSELRGDLLRASEALRRTLRQLRSLLVEIHPPGLNASGLGAALEDLTAQAASSGVTPTVTVSDMDGTPDHVVALIWRVAQEAIRNAVRHAGASRVQVDVHGDGRQVSLRVTDDGSGFDPGAAGREDSYGLRGLQSLVQDGGGDLQVESAPGAGTTVRMVVDRG
jgi:two-component system, NarL family, sensor kinase